MGTIGYQRKMRKNDKCPRSLYSSHFQEFRSGGWARNRTGDTRIFSPLLYQLSYPASRKRMDILHRRQRKANSFLEKIHARPTSPPSPPSPGELRNFCSGWRHERKSPVEARGDSRLLNGPELRGRAALSGGGGFRRSPARNHFHLVPFRILRFLSGSNAVSCLSVKPPIP